MAYPVTNDAFNPNKAVLEQLQLAFWNRIPDYPAIIENAEVRIRQLPDVVDEVVLFVKSWVLDGHKVDRIEPESIDFPATPWEFWKQEHAPKWFLERWPVKMKTTVVNRNIHKHYVCPHINIKEDRYPHIVWMYEHSGQKKD
jgi:hypothetical protein